MDQNMIRKMQKMQQELQQKSEIFMDQDFTLTKHGVTVIAKGSKKIVSIEISDADLLDPEDPEILQDILQLTINELFDSIDDKQQELMPNLPSGFGF
ncbi:YbaB/EbfC family nucleoid-associated protein [Mycoplasmopsis felifaucium]|uniref:YbaB/EbfC family nucleoid-associated protein n=1 Tax=Mycoplasmopsis felifaucium TaxID=35768 RepID=A0ABZ2RPQ2_9BACT|nr:YbaB/EbfC family nucleoid-associated protein [Mycoplasmopsis felifaucium]